MNTVIHDGYGLAGLLGVDEAWDLEPDEGAEEDDGDEGQHNEGDLPGEDESDGDAGDECACLLYFWAELQIIYSDEAPLI